MDNLACSFFCFSFFLISRFHHNYERFKLKTPLSQIQGNFLLVFVSSLEGSELKLSGKERNKKILWQQNFRELSEKSAFHLFREKFLRINDRFHNPLASWNFAMKHSFKKTKMLLRSSAFYKLRLFLQLGCTKRKLVSLLIFFASDWGVFQKQKRDNLKVLVKQLVPSSTNR